ncbi:hypothetical protein AB1Y20_000874 [Prymnesium parvum]|uniref:HORMA domain-containing protein n=1 Tax=Prymnesium parvum TaxID=97485 RepID=A0AB34KAD6_PRYPA
MSAVATAPEVVTPQVSLSMVRNMIRLNFCSIAYARSLFPADCFKAQEIGGNRFKTLGGKKLTDQSKTFLSWVEQGVFDALNRGFLERCVLVISNEEGKTVEAWSLSVKWLTDSNGKEYAELRQSAPGGHEIRQDLKSLRTKKGVQRATMQMMRNVTVLTQSLPKVPERHTISMRVLYRDDRTPPEYEPLGFCAAPSDGLALVFDTPPLQIGAGPAVGMHTAFHLESRALCKAMLAALSDTAHHAVAVSLITTDDLGDGHLPTGCERDGTDYSLDLGQMVDGGELRKEDAQLAHFDEEDEEQMQTWYFDRVVEILEDKEDGARVTTDWLAKAIGVPRNLAELFLSKLEKVMCVCLTTGKERYRETGR